MPTDPSKPGDRSLPNAIGSNVPDIDAIGIEYIRKMVRSRSGIVLDESKTYLIESRLAPLAEKKGFASLRDLIAKLRFAPFGDLHKAVLEAMTTNETSFFRDTLPFEALWQTVIPKLMIARKSYNALNLWCAASSSGQEPYSIAILLYEYFPQLANWIVNFLATDISTEMVERTRAGLYSEAEILRGLTENQVRRYFTREGNQYRINHPIRNMLTVREFNLTDEWGAMPRMDIVFMRNVLIYFDADTKKRIFERLARIMQQDSYLFLGAGETAFDLVSLFENVSINAGQCFQLRKTKPAK